jgi:hypothetical protein
VTGKKVKFGKFPWIVLKILTPFNAMFSGLVEMRYLWNREINLSGGKMQQRLDGGIVSTSLADALVESGIINS